MLQTDRIQRICQKMYHIASRMNVFSKVRNRFYKRMFRRIREHRKKGYAHIPKVELEEKHLANCVVLPSRQEMLGRLPKGGIVAELGVAEGDFTKDILALNGPSKLHLVDIWDSGSIRYGEPQRQRVLERYSKEIEEGRVQIDRGLSIKVGTSYSDGYFDWVYIDTDHSYSTTLEELRLYSRKVKSGGYLAGDDFAYLSKNSYTKFGVIEAVYQFCVEEGWEFAFLSMEIGRNHSFALRKIQ